MTAVTAAPYVLAQAIETAQFVSLTSIAGRHSTHHELVVDSSYAGTPWTVAGGGLTLATSRPTYEDAKLLKQIGSLWQLSITSVERSFIRLSDEDIARFDRALFSSTEFLYELPV